MQKHRTLKIVAFIAMLVYAGTTGNYSSSAQTPESGPFGFHMGESEAEVIAQVGRDHLINQGSPTQLGLYTAPKPHPEFAHYFLFFPLDKGLLMIRAGGRSITSGSELRAHFSTLKENLVKIYGNPSKESHLYCSWTNPANAAHIKVVVLEVGRSRDSSSLEIEYQFEGYSESLNAQKAKDDSVL